jgi:hypothetical protein
MNSLLLIFIIILAGGPLSFALARIAIRLQQEPSLAALASVLIFWQLIALSAGRAPLASAVMLLIGISALLILIQWLQGEAALGARTKWAMLILAGLGLAIAAAYPVLSLDQILVFSSGLGVAAAGTWCALRWARSPVSLGKSGLPALGLIALWLIVRATASFIAAME